MAEAPRGNAYRRKQTFHQGGAIFDDFPFDVLAGCGKTIFHASTSSHERKICNVFNASPVRPELGEG